MYSVQFTVYSVHCILYIVHETGTLHIKGTGTGTVTGNIKRTRTGTGTDNIKVTGTGTGAIN